jgi:hypothetical protein
MHICITEIVAIMMMYDIAKHVINSVLYWSPSTMLQRFKYYLDTTKYVNVNIFSGLTSSVNPGEVFRIQRTRMGRNVNKLGEL